MTKTIPNGAIKPWSDAESGDTTVWERYCPDCDEWRGWPEISDSMAEICDNPDECVRPDDWPNGVCGFVVCRECRDILEQRTRSYDAAEIQVVEVTFE